MSKRRGKKPIYTKRCDEHGCKLELVRNHSKVIQTLPNGTKIFDETRNCPKCESEKPVIVKTEENDGKE